MKYLRGKSSFCEGPKYITYIDTMLQTLLFDAVHQPIYIYRLLTKKLTKKPYDMVDGLPIESIDSSIFYESAIQFYFQAIINPEFDTI